jgi:transposase-like protein
MSKVCNFCGNKNFKIKQVQYIYRYQSYIHELRWKGKELECPHCGSEDIGSWGQYYRNPGLKRYICKGCGKTFNDLTGTILHCSHLPLSGWLLAAFLMALGCSLSRTACEIGSRFRNVYRIGWHLRNLALSYEISRKLEGIVEVDEIYQTCGMKGQAEGGGKKELERDPRSRGKKKERGRGHYDKDTPVIIAWVSRAGKVVLQVLRDFTSKTIKEAAMRAVKTGSTVYSDSAGSYQSLSEIGYEHDYVNHSKGEYARGEVHENRSEGMFSLLKPYIWVFRGISKQLLPAYIAFFQFLRNFSELNCFGKAELILQAGLDPKIAGKAREGEYAQTFIQPLMESG